MAQKTKDAKQTAAAEEQQPEEQQSEAPTFTIRADSKFGIKAMVALYHEAHTLGGDPGELLAKLREFELYAEANR